MVWAVAVTATMSPAMNVRRSAMTTTDVRGCAGMCVHRRRRDAAGMRHARMCGNVTFMVGEVRRAAMPGVVRAAMVPWEMRAVHCVAAMMRELAMLKMSMLVTAMNCAGRRSLHIRAAVVDELVMLSGGEMMAAVVVRVTHEMRVMVMPIVSPVCPPVIPRAADVVIAPIGSE